MFRCVDVSLLLWLDSGYIIAGDGFKQNSVFDGVYFVMSNEYLKERHGIIGNCDMYIVVRSSFKSMIY